MISANSDIRSYADSTSIVRQEDTETRWYAAYTRSRHEKSVYEQLAKKNVETFLPIYKTVHRWKNGDHSVELPLFPSYTFVRIALRDQLQVLKVGGVVGLVCMDRKPCPLDDGEIEKLRHALASEIRAMPHPYLTAGRRVRITAGPLSGVEGILLRRKGMLRMVISIDLIQRSVIADVQTAWLEPAFGQHRADIEKDFSGQACIADALI